MAQSQAARRQSLITQPVDVTKLVTLSGNTRAEASTSTDGGKVDDSFVMDHMLLQLQRGPAQEAAIQKFIDEQHDSKSPHFHEWLTAEQLGNRFGTTPEDLEKIKKWLKESGFTVNAVYPNGMTIDFSGTAGQIASALHTEIHQLSVNGKQHIANVSDPQIPAALAPAIKGFTALHDFRPRKMVRPKAQYTVKQSGTQTELVAPADLATIYDMSAAFSAGITGQGQTIAVIEDSDMYSATDWSNFRTAFGLSSFGGTLSTVHPAPTTGRNNCTDPGTSTGDDDEATLDVEWSTAAAPGAAIILAACNNSNTTDGLTIATTNLVNSTSPPQIISISYGSCEAGNGAAYNATYNSLFQSAVARGISVFVSTGDSGAAGCDFSSSDSASYGINVSGFASTPYNVAVGGTDFADTSQGTSRTYWSTTNSATYESAISYIPEIPWNDSCASQLIATHFGYKTGYGPGGYCASNDAINNGNITIGGGSGGPSGCATGVPAANLVVSGTCQGYPKPSWQTGLSGIPNDGVRDLPDVSMFAADGVWNHYYVYCFSDSANGGAACTGAPVNWSAAGGTSFSTPIMAGIQALVNQKMGGAQGNPNPVYYKLAASSVGSSVFHSISMGDSSVNCSGGINCYGTSFEARGRSTPPTSFIGNGNLSTTSGSYTPAFAATGGYSLATGIGSVDVYNLVLNWSKGQ